MDAYSIAKEEISRLKKQPRRLLEIGAGRGEFLQELVASHHAMGIGIDPYCTEYHADNVMLQRMEAENIASLRQWFDVVYSIKSFHHFSRPEKCVSALKSVIGWGGLCLLIDWHSGARTGIPEDYYSSGEAAAVIKSSGLRVVRERRTGDLFSISATLNTWNIAVATDERHEEIYPKMFGQAPQFAIYRFSPQTGFQLSEVRHNPYRKTLQHQKTYDVYDVVNDCQAVLSAGIGKKGVTRLEELGVCLFFARGDLEAALERTAFGIG